MFAGMKKFWNFIKHQRTDHSGVAPLKVNGSLITDPLMKAEALNDQFQSVFTRESDLDNIPTPKKTAATMPRIHITKPGVTKLLRQLNPGKAAGPDSISPRVLKELAEELSDPLTRIFQKSLEEKKVPSDWMEANVAAPVFKKGQRYERANYRQII